MPAIAMAERAARRALVPLPVRMLLESGDVRGMWDAWADEPGGIERQRDVIRALVAITVMPAPRGQRAFDPNLITLEWR